MPTTYSENFNPNANYYSRLPTSNTPPTIPVDALGGDTSAMNLPPPPGEPDYLGVLGAIPTIEQITDDPGETTTERTQNTLMQTILDSVKSLKIRPEAQLEAEKAAGLPQINTQLDELYSEIETLQKEAVAIPLKNQEEFAGRGATKQGVAPIETGQLRQNAIKALTASALAGALERKATRAQTQANRQVEIEFAREEARLKWIEKALEMNTSILTREDNDRALRIQAKLTERQRLLEERKGERTNINAVMLKAAEYGADSATLQRIRSAATYQAAIAAAGTFIQDPKAKYELEVARLDTILKQAQIAETRARTAQIGQPTADERKAAAELKLSNSAAAAKAIEAKTLIQDLRGHRAKGSSVGFTIGGGMFNPFARAEFDAKLEQLKSVLTLDQMKAFKGLGPMSEKEFATAAAAATSLSKKTTEKAFDAELAKLEAALTSTFRAASGFSEDEEAILNQVYPQSGAQPSNPAAYFAR